MSIEIVGPDFCHVYYDDPFGDVAGLERRIKLILIVVDFFKQFPSPDVREADILVPTCWTCGVDKLDL